MHVLIVNTGSSSLKLRLLNQDDALLGRGDLPQLRDRSDDAARAACPHVLSPDAVCHRIGHSRVSYKAATHLDARDLPDLVLDSDRYASNAGVGARDACALTSGRHLEVTRHMRTLLGASAEPGGA